MNLIEIIYTYASAVQDIGRAAADDFVLSAYDESIHNYIRNTVNDRGEVIGSLGERFDIVKLESVVDWVKELFENK